MELLTPLIKSPCGNWELAKDEEFRLWWLSTEEGPHVSFQIADGDA